MNTEQLTIWFAGFYEGEGCICNDISNNNKFRISIAQNDITPLEIGKSIWGGKIRERIRKSPASDLICKGYEWRLGYNEGDKFIRDIAPYLIIPYKIKQIEEAYRKAEEGLDRKFKCNFCDKEYASPGGRRRHELKEHINNGQEFKCDYCDNTYKSKDSMKRHVKINHKNTDASLSP